MEKKTRNILASAFIFSTKPPFIGDNVNIEGVDYILTKDNYFDKILDWIWQTTKSCKEDFFLETSRFYGEIEYWKGNDFSPYYELPHGYLDMLLKHKSGFIINFMEDNSIETLEIRTSDVHVISTYLVSKTIWGIKETSLFRLYNNGIVDYKGVIVPNKSSQYLSRIR